MPCLSSVSSSYSEASLPKPCFSPCPPLWLTIFPISPFSILPLASLSWTPPPPLAADDCDDTKRRPVATVSGEEGVPSRPRSGRDSDRRPSQGTEAVPNARREILVPGVRGDTAAAKADRGGGGYGAGNVAVWRTPLEAAVSRRGVEGCAGHGGGRLSEPAGRERLASAGAGASFGATRWRISEPLPTSALTGVDGAAPVQGKPGVKTAAGGGAKGIENPRLAAEAGERASPPSPAAADAAAAAASAAAAAARVAGSR